MHLLTDEIWEKGLSYDEYRADVERNQETFDEAYSTPCIEPDDLARLATLPAHRILAVAADWCPDVFHTLPTWARVTEELSQWELKVFPLARHPELMEPFLWIDEARVVPVYAFYNLSGRIQVWWSGRCAVAQREVDEVLGGRKFVDLDPGERGEASRRLDDAYRNRLRRQSFEEILTLLGAFYHRDQ